MSYKLIDTLKSKHEDFEFYPTTTEIINDIIKDINLLHDRCYHYNAFKFASILDIGAGNGKVLKAIKNAFDVKMYAIEKSKMLKTLLDEFVFIVGTDFHEQTLVDKEIDITFCNPPYSDFVEWTEKIIKESCSKYIYLVIPSRWKDSPIIQDSMKYRNAKFNVLGDYSFENAEDRRARAIVQLIRIDLSNNTDDAFNKYFNEEFKPLINKFDEAEKLETKKKNDKFSSLVSGENYVHSLVELYNYDVNNIKHNYMRIKELDISIMKEFEIDPQKILDLLKLKLVGLKNTYWKEVISKMVKITDKLTSKKRQSLLDTLNSNGCVDFTESNIYSIVLWILKNAGNYIDEQLIDVYEEMIGKANCINYKSNEKVFSFDRWRYSDENPTHFYLDFRLILSFHGAISRGYNNRTRLSERAGDYIRDLLTVANTLGFICNTTDHRLDIYRCENTWQPGKPQIFEYRGKQGKTGTLFEIKGHLNGNIHLRLNQKFALALNVEFGRLKKWIHSKEDACEELKNKDAAQYFRTDLTLLQNPFLQIDNKPALVKERIIVKTQEHKKKQILMSEEGKGIINCLNSSIIEIFKIVRSKRCTFSLLLPAQLIDSKDSKSIAFMKYVKSLNGEFCNINLVDGSVILKIEKGK